MSTRNMIVGIVSMALIMAVLIFCFHYNSTGDVMTEGTLVSSNMMV